MTEICIAKIYIYESPIFSVQVNNNLLHLILDNGATASLIKEKKCKELNITIHLTINRAVQVDGNRLDIVGEIHIMVNRDKLKLIFSAVVVKTMSTDMLAGTRFHVENDVYSRMATDQNRDKREILLSLNSTHGTDSFHKPQTSKRKILYCK